MINKGENLGLILFNNDLSWTYFFLKNPTSNKFDGCFVYPLIVDYKRVRFELIHFIPIVITILVWITRKQGRW